MNSNNHFHNNPFLKNLKVNGPSIMGLSGLSLLIIASVLNMSGFVSGLSFFALFILALIIMLSAVVLNDERKNDRNRGGDPTFG